MRILLFLTCIVSSSRHYISVSSAHMRSTRASVFLKACYRNKPRTTIVLSFAKEQPKLWVKTSKLRETDQIFMATTGIVDVMLFTVVWSYTCTASVCCGLLYAVRQRRQRLPAAAAVHRGAAARSSTSANRARHRCSTVVDGAGIRRRRRSPDDAVAVVVGLRGHSLESEQRP